MCCHLLCSTNPHVPGCIDTRVCGQTGNDLWFAISIFLVVLQFVVVQVRILPYLRRTFGSESSMYLAFLFLGFPFGLLALDGLMFMEPVRHASHPYTEEGSTRFA